METEFNPQLRANVTRDDDGRVRHILHTQYRATEAATPRRAAEAYVRDVAEMFQIPTEQLDRLHQHVDFLAPRPEPIEYRFHEVKRFFSTSTFAYYQTIDNTPVWDGGLTVSVKEAPARIVHAENRGHSDLAVDLPPQEVIERIRRQLTAINAGQREPAPDPDEARTALPRITFRRVFPSTATGEARAAGRQASAAWLGRTRLRRGRFYIYRYDADERQPGREGKAPPPDDIRKGETKLDTEAIDVVPTLPLPPVPDRILDGQHYLVAEIVFRVGDEFLDWKALVEIETGTILRLRPMVASVNGLVFTYDPKTSTGVLTNDPDSQNATLDPMRDDVTLQNLNAPVGGVQSLSGTNVMLSDDDLPTFAPPNQPTGNDFDYHARTNEFSAVNAYYHADNFFELVEGLGFTLSGAGAYFDGTTFPVHVDHRASIGTASSGIEVNAACYGDAGGASGDGIGLVAYALSDDTGTADTTTNPLGRAVDKWVHWHEIGGHGILYDHVSGPNFGFAHSAGDTLAAFQNDPESLLRSLPERFQYAPFRFWPAGSDRWFNRTVASGWGWGGSNDAGGYNTEQIIATTLFRAYQAFGGDAAEVSKRWHASRVGTYLVLNAVGKLSPGANANSAMDLYNKLALADADDWTSEGLSGGAYGKVLRWTFEKQGLWRASGAPTTDPGQPPAVDLYIDDGRGGEYQYLANHWTNQSVWNRTAQDGIYGEQPGVAGVESYAYVRVKNRGTTDASGTVKVYHSLPGAGLTWPTDFVQAGPAAGLPTSSVLANNGNTVTVGPFAWTPNVNAYGHDCLLAVVETAQDPSNLANFTPSQTIQEWRLVPHDNNIGQRNVQLVPGGGESAALSASLEGVFFMAGNNLLKAAQMELRVRMPRVLESHGWSLGFARLSSPKFRLEAGEKRRIELKLAAGTDFTADEVRAEDDRDIVVTLLADGMILGGMSYRVDPDIKEARTPPRPDDRCNHVAQGLLDCLDVGRSQKVRHVRVKKVSLDIELESDGCD
jgi:zinc metalloprotease ZmpB